MQKNNNRISERERERERVREKDAQEKINFLVLAFFHFDSTRFVSTVNSKKYFRSSEHHIIIIIIVVVVTASNTFLFKSINMLLVTLLLPTTYSVV